MDSGLGSDEDRRGRTKEQKQLRNQQLLSGCFIDAASLSDEAEVAVDRRSDERRQGALIFQSSIPQFSMLQMTASESALSSSAPVYSETTTPYNSIVQLDEEETTRKSPLGFYVDLSDVPEPPKTPPSTSAKKNIFSMVIDFEGPKKEKPTKLSSSLNSHKKIRNPKHFSLGKGGNCSSLSSSVSSINSVAGPSRQFEDEPVIEQDHGIENNCSSSSKSSGSSDSNISQFKNGEECLNFESERKNNEEKPGEEEEIKENLERPKANINERPQFVKLSDLECQKPKLDINFTPRMSKSIPEASWVESPLLMSRSTSYRSAPHPMEPESGELSDSGSISEAERPASKSGRSFRRLGTDLFRMFLEEMGPDVVIEVEGHELKAHKCILASRCQYFAALLSGNWLEDSGNVISLKGFTFDSVYFALCHIYSGASYVPNSINLVELASLADMLSLEGLKEVVEHALKQRYCHNFHRPCAGCCLGVIEVLPLAAAYGLEDLYQKCLQWVAQHFVKVWPSATFSALPRELREKCYQYQVVHMTADKVLHTQLKCDKIAEKLPDELWAERVRQLVLQLSDACHLYLRQHYAAVLNSSSFLAQDREGWDFGEVVPKKMLAAAKNLGVEQACRSYSRCCKMLEQQLSPAFHELMAGIREVLEQCLVSQSDRLIRSNAWLRLDSALRCRIKDLTPVNEPVSRLPRAAPRRAKKVTAQSTTKPQGQSPTISSSDSSRNTSPGLNQGHPRLHNAGGSPSLRRSLLLAARAPQVPPSPSTNRRSTLTQPTQSSAAKSAPSKNIKTTPRNPPPPKTTTTPQKKSNVTTARMTASNPNLKKTSNRSSSPLKPDSKTTSPRKVDRVASPIKADVKAKRSSSKVQEPVGVMQRSSTFLKDEPTVLGKII